VHPHEAGAAASRALEDVRELAAGPEVVGIGETGLDYHYDHAPRPVQRSLFDAHLALAADLGLPVVVHSREADEDVAAALRNAPSSVLGVLHCFAGGARSFEAAMALSWYVSFSGIASFKSFAAIPFLHEVPPDRILVETDAPSLAPVPRRGQRNEPAGLPCVVEAVAARRGEEPDAVAARTSATACRLYGVGA
jgi:TatD DNase family protein